MYSIIIRFVAIISFAFISFLTNAQFDRAIKKFKATCVSGNCINGEGVYSEWYEAPAGSVYIPDNDYKSALYLVYYSGIFKDTLLKEGKVYLIGMAAKNKYVKKGIDYVPFEEMTWEKVKQKNKPFYEGQFLFKQKNPFDQPAGRDFFGFNYFEITGRGKLYYSNLLVEGFFHKNVLVEGEVIPLQANSQIEKFTGFFMNSNVKHNFQNKFLKWWDLLNYYNLSPVYGTIQFRDGRLYTGSVSNAYSDIYSLAKYGYGYLFNSQKELIQEGFFIKDSVRKIHPIFESWSPIANEKTQYQTQLYLTKTELFLNNSTIVSSTPDTLLYAGPVNTKNQPEGFGVLRNKGFEKNGLQYFYAGFFANGIKDGPGSRITREGLDLITGFSYKSSQAQCFYEKNELKFVDLSIVLPLEESGIYLYKGETSSGFLQGQGYLEEKTERNSVKKAVSEGSFYRNVLNGKGTRKFSNFFGQTLAETGIFSAGQLVKGNKSNGAAGLAINSVVNYKGKKAVVTSIGFDFVKLHDGRTIPLSDTEFSITNESPSSFQQTCYLCGGKGSTSEQVKSGYYAVATDKTTYSGSTIRGDYVKVTTTYSPILKTISKPCTICYGSGKIFKK
jgi:hypothetical protein